MASFPVDAVYTWVDGDDPAWRARFAEHARAHASSAAVARRRFACLGTLQASVRALLRLAPWIRRVHVITDDQTPRGLPDDPRIRLCSHRAVFRDPADLPSFSSSAIEAQLAFVPGLAEHFLYLNDDMLIASEVEPGDFFTDDGAMRAFFGSDTLWPSALSFMVERGALHTRKLLHTIAAYRRAYGGAEPRGARTTLGLWRRELHQVAPLRRSVLEAAWSHPRLGPLVRATSAARFRDPATLEVVYLARLLACRTGAGVVSEPPPHLEVHLTDDAAQRARARARVEERRPTLLCLNDDLEREHEAARRELSAWLPAWLERQTGARSGEMRSSRPGA